MVEGTVKKKLVIMIFSTLLLLVILNLSITNANDILEVQEKTKNIVEKTQGEEFIVDIEFKNIGKNPGSWSINIAFEGDYWSQEGIPKDIELDPNEKKKLIWEGVIPNDAPTNTLARLVVYYDDTFIALNWWIHVVPGAELSIISSCVK